MIENNFAKDVLEGLSSEPRCLSSKYFYDDRGDALFVQIMHMPEYYLTDSEREIFEEQTEDIAKAFELQKAKQYEIIELGAGDGSKTKILLRYLLNAGYNFKYFPIDISHNALDKLAKDLVTDLPDLDFETKQGDYFGVLSDLKHSNAPKVVLFLGSNLGNMDDAQSTLFLNTMSQNLNSRDLLFLGLDLKKSPEIILPAYNDAQGITRAFNLNLLTRINTELGGNFNISQFDHKAKYDSENGMALSFIQSNKDQEVHISSINKTFRFQAGELIHTEVSRKYDDQLISKLISSSDFIFKTKLTDRKEYFADYILEVRRS